MNTIESVIKEIASSLTERIIEIRYMDVDEMEVAIQSQIKIAIYKCCKAQISDMEEEKKNLSIIYQKHQGTGSNDRERFAVQSKLTELNLRLKEKNLIRTEIEQVEKLKLMIKFLKETAPELLSKFYEGIDEKVSESITK